MLLRRVKEYYNHLNFPLKTMRVYKARLNQKVMVDRTLKPILLQSWMTRAITQHCLWFIPWWNAKNHTQMSLHQTTIATKQASPVCVRLKFLKAQFRQRNWMMLTNRISWPTKPTWIYNLPKILRLSKRITNWCND